MKLRIVHRETTEVDFFYGSFVKTNSINGYSEKIHFQIGITKKAVLINWSSRKLKSVKWNFLEKVCVYDFFENRFHWLKFLGHHFAWKKINGNQLNWFKVNRSEYHRRKFLEIYSSEVESMKTAFISGERRIKVTPMRGLPGETTSYKCNAWKLVSLKVNPGELIWLMEKLWKLTSSIEKPDQPISSMNNPSKSLSTIEKQWKSLSSVRNPIAQFSLEKRSWKHFVDMFSSIKFLLTKFVWKLYQHPQKTSVNWLEAHTLHSYSIGSPSKTNLFMENQGKLFQGQKTQKLQSLKRKHSKFIFIEKKTVWIDFVQKDPFKKIIEKKTKSI